MDNPEKLATFGIQDDEKQNKTTTQYVLDTHIRNQTQITSKRHEPSYKHLERQTEHRFHTEIATNILTRNSQRKDT
jgi:hypothetical protein